MIHHRTFEHMGILVICAGIVACLNMADSAFEEMDQSYQVVSATPDSMAGEIAYAVPRKRMVAVAGWSPHWLNARFPLKYLKDPQGVFGESDGICSVARKDFSRENPQVARFIRQFRWKAADLDRLALCCYEEKNDYEAGARRWMDENPELIARWTKGVLPQTGARIRLVNCGNSSELAVNALMKQILEERLFCRVSVVSAEMPAALASLADGTRDLMVTVWMFNAVKKELAGIRSRVEMLGCNLSDVEFGIAVPEYAPLESIADLKNYHRQFGGRILGIRPEQCMLQRTRKAISAYGLDDSVVVR